MGVGIATVLIYRQHIACTNQALQISLPTLIPDNPNGQAIAKFLFDSTTMVLFAALFTLVVIRFWQQRGRKE